MFGNSHLNLFVGVKTKQGRLLDANDVGAALEDAFLLLACVCSVPDVCDIILSLLGTLSRICISLSIFAQHATQTHS